MAHLGWQCFNCDCVFEEHEAEWHKTYEKHYWLDDQPVKELTFMACPECGCEDIDEVWIDDEEDESTE